MKSLEKYKNLDDIIVSFTTEAREELRKRFIRRSPSKEFIIAITPTVFAIFSKTPEMVRNTLRVEFEEWTIYLNPAVLCKLYGNEILDKGFTVYTQNIPGHRLNIQVNGKT